MRNYQRYIFIYFYLNRSFSFVPLRNYLGQLYENMMKGILCKYHDIK